MRTLHPRTPTTAGHGIVVLLLLMTLAGAVALVFPVREGLRLDRQLSAARARIAELETLHPLYLALQAFSPDKQWPDLPRPARRALTQSDVQNVPVVFSEMARTLQMELISVRPRVSASQTGRMLQVDLQVAGPYVRIRDFLLAVVGLPSLEQVTSLEIKRNDMHETMSLSINLALL